MCMMLPEAMLYDSQVRIGSSAVGVPKGDHREASSGSGPGWEGARGEAPALGARPAWHMAAMPL